MLMTMLEERDRYFVKVGEGPWRECDMAEFVRQERRAGFHNTMGRDDLPGTGGFGNGAIDGRVISTEYATPEQYAWDPEFCAVAWPTGGDDAEAE